MTLVELLVSIATASVLMTAIAVVFFGVLRGVTTVNVKTTGTADARIALEAMTRALRVAVKPATRQSAFDTRFAMVNSQRVAFYALLYRNSSTGAATPTAAPDPMLVKFDYQNSCITQTLVPMQLDASGAPAWDGTGTTTCLARTTQPPAFRYFSSGAPKATEYTTGTTDVTSSNLPLIQSIEMTVTIQDVSRPQTKDVVMSDRVTMSNIAS